MRKRNCVGMHRVCRPLINYALTAEQEQTVLAIYKAGYSYNSTAREAGRMLGIKITPNVVRVVQKKHGVPMNSKPKNIKTVGRFSHL